MALTNNYCSDEPKVDKDVLKHVILQHQARAIQSANEEDVQRIHIRRSHLLSDALRQFSRASFDVEKSFKSDLLEKRQWTKVVPGEKFSIFY